MDFKTVEKWDDEVWGKVSIIYFEAFAGKGAKPEKIIRHMFHKGIAQFHVANEEGQTVAMALTGGIQGNENLIIDYMAVSTGSRLQGIGSRMLNYIEEWAVNNRGSERIIIEAEAEETPENKERIRFWEKNGFTLTGYVHQYIWVPEPYKAMYKNLQLTAQIPSGGEALFDIITRFHGVSFRGA